MCVKKNLAGIAKSVSLVVALTTGLTTVTAVLSPVAMAAAEKQQLSSKMKPLGEAQKLMADKKWKEALAVINEKVVPITGKTAYEETVTNEFKAACLMQLKDFAGVAKVYETMLAANQVPADQVSARTMTLAELYLSVGDFSKAIETYERYLKTNAPTSDVYLGLTQANFKKQDYKKSAEYAEKLIKLAEQNKKPVDKTWLQMLGFSYSKQGNNEGYADVLAKLLDLYPSAEYWNDMLKITKNEVNYSDREKIEFYRLKKAVGAISEAELNDMAELALALNDAGDAKTALEAEPSSERTNRLLAKAKADAAQDAATLDAEAAKAATKPDGEALAKIGAAYLGQGQYDKAATTIQAAIAKGGLKAVDESYVRLGVANLNLGKKADAIKSFQSVSDKSKLSRLAKLWVIYVSKK